MTNPCVNCAALMCILLASPISAGAQDCPEWDHVRYSAPDQRALDEVSVTPITQAQLNESIKDLTRTKSRHGTAYFAMRTADTIKVGPWTTIVFIGGNLGRPIGLSVSFSNHASYGVDAVWINEKLLFLRVARGRVVSMELILDVEAQRVIYVEQADSLILVLPCDQKRPPG